MKDDLDIGANYKESLNKVANEYGFFLLRECESIFVFTDNSKNVLIAWKDKSRNFDPTAQLSDVVNEEKLSNVEIVNIFKDLHSDILKFLPDKQLMATKNILKSISNGKKEYSDKQYQNVYHNIIKKEFDEKIMKRRTKGVLKDFFSDFLK